MHSPSARFHYLFPGILAMGVLGACVEAPTANDAPASFAKGGKPGGNTNDCGSTPLRITFRDDAADALRSDGGGVYEEGTDGGVHLNGATGRLMLWTSQYDTPTRFVHVHTSVAPDPFVTSDRIYTNGHDPDTEGCGFKEIPPGGTGSAVFEAELDAHGIVRYGKFCDGSLDPTTRVVVTRSSDELSWTVEGTNGRHCQSNDLRGRNAGMGEVGSAGAFFMTLEDTSG